MQFVIQGGKPLQGEVAIGGAKNGAFPLMAAALLTGQSTTLHNIPDIADIRNMIELVTALGVEVSFANHTLKIHARQLTSHELKRDISKRLRASIELTAPVLVRLGKVVFPHPGGCVIGERPIDLFLDGYQKMGAISSVIEEMHELSMERPKAITFVFPSMSTTATMCLMMLGTIADGTTTLINCACEPEISMLADFLNQAGANVSGAGSPTITIEGIEKYPDREIAFSNIPDRVETGSFLFLAAATKGHLTLTHTNPSHQAVVLDLLARMGVTTTITADTIEIFPPDVMKAVSVKTHEYPGFATDLQSPLIIALTQANGKSIVHETVFEGRMFWLEDLKRMGAHVMILDTHRGSIEGPSKLKGKELKSPDLRAGMAYIIAGLVAKGKTTIHDVEIIDRGYEGIEEKLKALGADIKRVS
ncbi:MAG: UDP-N-acetylglucosamine 1-carboxyvinyltransferase [Patescibacteria group bacterium]